MSIRRGCIALLLCALGLAGCGGDGGGSTPAKSTSAKVTARTRVITTCRIEQASFAIVGLGRPITRTARPKLGLLALVPLTLRAARDVTQGQDSDTRLYYTRTINADGSGQLALFLDAARSMSAGNFAWGQPTWNQGKLNSYPATIHMTFQITAGQFGGNSGTLDNTTQDITGNNETLHLVLTDPQNETITSDFKVVNGVLTGKAHGTLFGGIVLVEDDTVGTDGVLQCQATFSDGSSETLTTDPNGAGTESYYDPNGVDECNTNYDDSGNDTINYDDGSSETVNVDNNSDNSNNSGDSQN